MWKKSFFESKHSNNLKVRTLTDQLRG